MKIKISAVLRIIISFGLLGLLFWYMRDDISGIGETLVSANIKWLALAAFFLLINVSMLAYRMKIIFQGEDIYIFWKESFKLTVIGYFFNNFMPTAVGGDIIKAHIASQDNNKRLQSYASVLMDRFVGLYTFLVVAAVALAVDRGRIEQAALRPIVIILLLVGVMGFILVTNKTIAALFERALTRLKMFSLGEKIKGIYRIVHDYRNRKKILLKAFSVSVLSQSIYFIVIYIFFLALETDISIGNIFLIMPVVTFISMIPSIGGLGVREGAMVAFFMPLVGEEKSFAVSLLLLSGFFFLSIIGGVFYLWRSISSSKKSEMAPVALEDEAKGVD